MPHLRARILKRRLEESAKHSPVVAVFGQRQSGKTTLLKGLSAESKTFDDPAFSRKVEEGGLPYLLSLKSPLLLDEVQKFPPIFDLVKLRVDEHKRPGQFFMTGSVRFSGKKQVRESLTGRTTLWELLPLTLSECRETEFSDLVEDLASKNPLHAIKQRTAYSIDDLNQYMNRGGLPGICFTRSEAERTNALDSHLATLLERDLDFIVSLRISKDLVYRLLRSLVALQGMNINFSQLGRTLRLSVPTIQKLVHAMEGLFLIRTVGRSMYFDDPALARHLSPADYSETELRFRHLLFCELRAQAIYRKDKILGLIDHSTRGGAWVPFVLELRSGRSIAITFDPMSYPSQKSLLSLASFKKVHRNAILVSCILGGEIHQANSGVLVCPITQLVG